MKLLHTFVIFIGLSLSLHASAAGLPDFTDLVKKLSPSIVNISTVQERPEESDSIMRGPQGEEIPEIFRDFFRGFQGPGPQQRPSPQSLGSGFIISDDGYVLTNHHVVEGADKVIVRLNDRRELEAELIGSDERSDVALLKVDADDLPALEIGDSEALEVGEWVLAIGSPFGFDQSVTAGIVSAKERSLAGDSYVPFIQTDVAINPGNSGGPLLNLDGEVVGINSQIYTRSGGFMGLSFAIPIDVAMDVSDQLRDQGFVTRGWLGVFIQEVNRDLAESFGLDKPSGALVAQVMSGSPAEDAGLQEGDVILEFNGREIGLSSELPAQVGRVAPGEIAELLVMRGGRETTIDVEIGVLSEESAMARPAPANPKQREDVLLGMRVTDLDNEAREELSVDSGVLVEEVMNGPASSAGIMGGDVITLIDGKEIDSVETLEEVVEGLADGKPVAIRVIRQGTPTFLAIRPE